ncbi:MAG TPA: HsdR family type I site-specific deoxyribonuclease [Blastocatellia bacterium]|nr:HsdR family type I site-specific deoxyribonuclease [Blastocatellia bacterium]
MPAFLEDHASQIPALQLLQHLGYVYLRREEVHLERGGKLSNALLEGLLEKQLRSLNRINFKGADHEFSGANIEAAIQTLKDVVLTDGLIRANERIYDLLSLGKSFEQTIDGDTKSFTLNYVDWKRPENNVFHVAEEFEVEIAGGARTCRADIVLFVNGIPFVVIECNRPDVPNVPNEKGAIKNAVMRHLRNQQSDYIPRLFVYSQMLLAIARNEAKYATTGTPFEFWAHWREREDGGQEAGGEVGRLVNKPLMREQKDKLFADRFAYARRYFDELETEGRAVTEQDRAIYCLLRPERLIELTRQFIVFDAGQKKIARYQQYFAVKKTLERIKRVGEDGRRAGGVIWHTQGSGKSLTMVMMAKAIALEESVADPRIVLVTDRIDLDDQIWATFHSCGKEPVKATTGRHLLELLARWKAAVITTVIDKFESAVKASSYQSDSNNIFALVDESHRSQYGETNARMQKALPNACYIGFTGTPLKKKDKNTAAKFGGVIDAYTIDEAVRDKAVVPLLYEGRRVSPETGRRILTVAWDISEHFIKNVPKPFKAQLAMESKSDAIKYKQHLDEIGAVTSEVLISAPEAREGGGAFERAGAEEVQVFWRRMMEKYGNEKEYNRSLIEAFNKSDEPEIIIVVDKLLTGFDSPRNTVLYLDKSLKGHSLLQAVARVNRLSEGKEFGFIIDYFGVLSELGKALDLYTSLPEFEREDLTLALTDISEEAAKLPRRHSELCGVFRGLDERRNEEAFERLLGDEELRGSFYEKFSVFNRTMSVAFSSAKFISDTPGERLELYKKDLVFFQKLRVRVKQLYAEEIDFREHEVRIQKLIDSYTASSGTLRIPPLASIFDKEAFQAQVSIFESPASKAETIANRTKKAIAEKMEDAPSFYLNSSKILDDLIVDWREGRIADAESLKFVTEVMNKVRDRSDDDLPPELRDREVARAFYGVVNDVFSKLETPRPDARKIATETAMEIDRVIQERRVVDWTSKPDVQNAMRNQIEDYLYDLKKHRGIDLGFDDMDFIIENSINIAKTKYAQ